MSILLFENCVCKHTFKNLRSQGGKFGLQTIGENHHICYFDVDILFSLQILKAERWMRYFSKGSASGFRRCILPYNQHRLFIRKKLMVKRISK